MRGAMITAVAILAFLLLAQPANCLAVAACNSDTEKEQLWRKLYMAESALAIQREAAPSLPDYSGPSGESGAAMATMHAAGNISTKQILLWKAHKVLESGAVAALQQASDSSGDLLLHEVRALSMAKKNLCEEERFVDRIIQPGVRVAGGPGGPGCCSWSSVEQFNVTIYQPVMNMMEYRYDFTVSALDHQGLARKSDRGQGKEAAHGYSGTASLTPGQVSYLGNYTYGMRVQGKKLFPLMPEDKAGRFDLTRAWRPVNTFTRKKNSRQIGVFPCRAAPSSLTGARARRVLGGMCGKRADAGSSPSLSQTGDATGRPLFLTDEEPHHIRDQIIVGSERKSPPGFDNQCAEAAFKTYMTDVCDALPSYSNLRARLKQLTDKANDLADSFNRYRKMNNQGAARFVKNNWRDSNDQRRKLLDEIEKNREDYAKCWKDAVQKAEGSCKRKQASIGDERGELRDTDGFDGLDEIAVPKPHTLTGEASLREGIQSDGARVGMPGGRFQADEDQHINMPGQHTLTAVVKVKAGVQSGGAGVGLAGGQPEAIDHADVEMPMPHTLTAVVKAGQDTGGDGFDIGNKVLHLP